jgi:exosortase D (VPLPA-CTERM-specific)
MTIADRLVRQDVAGQRKLHNGPILLGLAFVATCLVFREGLAQMLLVWQQRPDYRHAFLVLPLIAVLLWQRRQELAASSFRGSWLGFGLVLAGLGLNLVGKFGSVYTLQQAGFVLSLVGIALVFTHLRALPALWLPMLLLVLVVPLPNFLSVHLFALLEPASTTLATALMRLLGVAVFSQGGVLDFATLQMSPDLVRTGLEFVVPVATAGLIVACLARGRAWRRALIALCTVPAVIVANGLVIASIGLFADRGHLEWAEVVVSNKGVIVGAIALVSVLLLAWLLFDRKSRVSRRNDLRALETSLRFRVHSPATSMFATTLVLLAGVLAVSLPNRAEAVPGRTSFEGFPMQIGNWAGVRQNLDPADAAQLQLDDYLLAEFRTPGTVPVNFYVAWYDTQRAGRSVHSPNSCLPGEGWKIHSLTQVDVPGAAVDGTPLRANRVVVEFGGHRQLVYYWFQQRGRVITNEYMVKGQLFWDGLARNRSDGALVRMVAPLPDPSSDSQVEQQLVSFIQEAAPRLGPFVPN